MYLREINISCYLRIVWFQVSNIAVLSSCLLICLGLNWTIILKENWWLWTTSISEVLIEPRAVCILWWPHAIELLLLCLLISLPRCIRKLDIGLRLLLTILSGRIHSHIRQLLGKRRTTTTSLGDLSNRGRWRIRCVQVHLSHGVDKNPWRLRKLAGGAVRCWGQCSSDVCVT